MKKSIYATALASAAALGLAACGAAPEDEGDDTGDDDGNDGASDYHACLISDSGGWDDQSFNQSAMNGLQQAVEELGVQESDAESESDADYVPNVESMMQENCDLTVGVGFLLEEALHDAAEDNPDADFALVDDVFVDDDDNPVDLDNGRALVFNTAEASYLAGYLSAGMTETGVVATFGGLQIPSVSIFMDGFADGVDKYNEDNDDDVDLLGWDKEDQDGAFSGDFEDQSQGQALTEQFMAQDADIIMPVAGPVGLGAAAAAEAGDDVWIVGVDEDWTESTEYGDIVLTSVVKEIDQAVFDSIEDGAQGNFDSEDYVGTLENDGVDLAPSEAADVPDDLQAEVDDLKEQIVSGEITVETPNAP